MASPTRISVLMALYNAGPHLAPQLDSIAAQSHADWDLTISDDGASDGSRSRAEDFAATHPGRVRVIDGPGRGFAQNFLHLIAGAGPEVPMVALSDHDDVWLPDKLARAHAALSARDPSRPVLYCARTLVCDVDLVPIRPSPIWPHPFSFGNSLVQNVAAGNTIVLNRAALDLAQAAAPAAMAAGGGRGIVAHDWWLYQLVIGAGGQVIRDNQPVLHYRQHAGNEMGRNDTLAAWRDRFGKILSGTYRDWNGRNIEALHPFASRLTAEARAQLMAFAGARQSPFPARIAGMRRAGICRQTRSGALVIWLAALLNRL